MLRLVSSIGRLTNPQHLPVLRRMRISQAQFLVLDGLTEAALPMRMSDLARVAGLQDSELTRVVSELEGKQWVERTADPEDGRAKLVEPTREGARLIRRAHGEAAAHLRAVWSEFTHEEWHRFIDYLRRFENGLRRTRTEQETTAKRGPRSRKEHAP